MADDEKDGELEEASVMIIMLSWEEKTCKHELLVLPKMAPHVFLFVDLPGSVRGCQCPAPRSVSFVFWHYGL